MFRRITIEMIEFFTASGLECEKDGEDYVVRKKRRRWLSKTSWRLRITDGDSSTAASNTKASEPDVFLSLFDIPAEVREYLALRNVMWIDITRKEQSRVENDLGQEVTNFFKRYGVRTLRYPPLDKPAAIMATHSEGI